MKISNEVKVGILGVVTLFLLIWGYNFLKGNNILSNDIVVTAHFSDVAGLDVGAPITINGFRVGSVTDLFIDDTDPSRIVAELNIDKGTKIPDDAVAVLISPSIMSGKAVSMNFSGTCSGSDCLEGGEVIEGRVPSMFDPFLEMAEPYLNKMDSVVNVFKEIATSEEGGLRKSYTEIQSTIANVKVISDLMTLLVEKSSGSFVNTMGHMEAITANVRKNNDQISALMSNVTEITNQLKGADLDKTIGSTKETIEKFGKVAEEVKLTLAETNKLMLQLQSLTDLSNKDGLLPALLNDKQLLEDVKKTLAQASLLVADIKNHPERYRTVLSSKYRPFGTGKAYEKEEKLRKQGKIKD